VVSVVAEAAQPFTGEALSKAFRNNRLKFGDQGIYHRMTFRDGRERPVFSVANLVKPGTFPAEALEQFSTPGLTLFLQLPAPIENLEAFDDFVKTAERLAVELGGELRDEQHQVLTHQGLMLLRECIAASRFPSVSTPA
jgi:cell division protein ZipA